MKVVIFCHSLISDWNHGNAHFLRGICLELQARGLDVEVFEPEGAWSAQHLREDAGPEALAAFAAAYPSLRSTRYELAKLDLTKALTGADLVLVHEWNEPELVRRIGLHHAAHREYTLFFHDTHHRSVTATAEMSRYDLSHYDAVLAFGDVVRRKYLDSGWAKRAFTWHEAADVRTFAPPARPAASRGDLVWIGNFGDDERTRELEQMLIAPVRRLGLQAAVYGVRYPESVRAALAEAGIEYRGYLPNWQAPRVFSEFRLTVHIPRRPYAAALPGIPTIRPFEALACGIPLVSAPWSNAEGLFSPGTDYLVVDDAKEMEATLARLLGDPYHRQRLAEAGRATILSRHTCGHRVDELLSIDREVRAPRPPRAPVAAAHGVSIPTTQEQA